MNANMTLKKSASPPTSPNIYKVPYTVRFYLTTVSDRKKENEIDPAGKPKSLD